MARLLPFTVREAVDPERAADPRVVLPSVNVTVPVGAALPLAGFTVAVSTVFAEEGMLAGLAVTVVVVAMSSVTVADPEELAKPPAAA